MIPPPAGGKPAADGTEEHAGEIATLPALPDQMIGNVPREDTTTATPVAEPMAVATQHPCVPQAPMAATTPRDVMIYGLIEEDVDDHEMERLVRELLGGQLKLAAMDICIDGIQRLGRLEETQVPRPVQLFSNRKRALIPIYQQAIEYKLPGTFWRGCRLFVEWQEVHP
ncbi:hypothetical protein WJX73_006704 [Symbiochloris irregularis]|uniref:Uncharacterized protein n=1 Tax=Symbiochloris irregularis TaxID=706552 RepID=A0AAW1P5T0_9CHLO